MALDSGDYYCVPCGWTGSVPEDIPAPPADCPECGEAAPEELPEDLGGE